MAEHSETPSKLQPLLTWRSSLCDSELEPTTRHVALTLALYMNERGGSAFPGATRLAHDTGLSVSTVRDHLGRLVNAGWLVLVVKGGIAGERKTANQYQAVDPSGKPTGAEDAPLRETALTPPGNGAHPSSSRTPSLQELSTNTPGAFEHDFEDLWTDFPRKGDRRRALRAYQARRRQGVSHSDLLQAVRNYARHHIGTEERFLKQGGTFLNDSDGPWSEWVEEAEAPAARGYDPNLLPR